MNTNSRNNKKFLGKMEKIDVGIIKIDELNRLLFDGKILNAASIVAFHKALSFHNYYYSE
jgi:hypothetical protein